MTQAAVYHGENDQSRKTVDANKQISDCYYQCVDIEESDHLNQMNESIVNKDCDTVRDLAICDDVEKNDAFTSIEQESQGDMVYLIIIQVLMNESLLKIRQRICKMNKNYQVNVLIIMR